MQEIKLFYIVNVKQFPLARVSVVFVDIECDKWVFAVDIWERFALGLDEIRGLSWFLSIESNVIVLSLLLKTFVFFPYHVTCPVRAIWIHSTQSQKLFFTKQFVGVIEKKNCLFYSLDWISLFQLIENEICKRNTQIVVALGGEITII